MPPLKYIVKTKNPMKRLTPLRFLRDMTNAAGMVSTRL